MTFPVEMLTQCWFLAGPTACGKTAVSLRLADRINAEIIALDSMTVYRGLDIGTAKPSVDERSRIRHHLIDIVDPRDDFSLADFISHAESACREVISRNHIPLFVGGTGLYLRGILRGLFEGPPANWPIRQRLEEISKSDGPQELHHKLRQVDAVSADRLHPNDQRRIIRALEVFEMTGQPLSVLQNNGPRPKNERPSHVFWLSPPRDWLYERIDQRVEQMFLDGLVDEVQQLIKRNEPISQTARQALGYKEVIDWLKSTSSSEIRPDSDRGDVSTNTSLCELTALIQTRTRQFAKRQHTWFRNLEECRAISIVGNETPDQIADWIVRASKGE